MRSTQFLNKERFFQDANGQPISIQLSEAARQEHWEYVRRFELNNQAIWPSLMMEESPFFLKLPATATDIPASHDQLDSILLPPGTAFAPDAKASYVYFEGLWIWIGPFVNRGRSANVKIGYVLNPEYTGSRLGVLKIIFDKSEDPAVSDTFFSIAFQSEKTVYKKLKDRGLVEGQLLAGSRYSLSNKVRKTTELVVDAPSEPPRTVAVGKKYYLWLPYKGVDLYEVMSRVEEMTASQAFAILMQIALQLTAEVAKFHAANVEHGDLKLENLLMMNQGEGNTAAMSLQLTDFGSTTIQRAARVFFKVKGTYEYLPPEDWKYFPKLLEWLGQTDRHALVVGTQQGARRNPINFLEDRVPSLHHALWTQLKVEKGSFEALPAALHYHDGLVDWRAREAYQVGLLLLLITDYFFFTSDNQSPDNKLFLALPDVFQKAIQAIQNVGLDLAKLLPNKRITAQKAHQRIQAILCEIDAAFPDFDPDVPLFRIESPVSMATTGESSARNSNEDVLETGKVYTPAANLIEKHHSEPTGVLPQKREKHSKEVSGNWAYRLFGQCFRPQPS